MDKDPDKKHGDGEGCSDSNRPHNEDEKPKAIFKKVVIVDDNEVFSYGIQKITENTFGVTDEQVLVFKDRREALDFIRSTRGDVLAVLDYYMPGDISVSDFIEEAGDKAFVVICSGDDNVEYDLPPGVPFIQKINANQILPSAIDLFLKREDDPDSKQISLDFSLIPGSVVSSGAGESHSPTDDRRIERRSSIPPTVYTDDKQPEIIEYETNKLVVIVDDRSYRRDEMHDLVEDVASRYHLREFIDVLKTPNRFEVLEEIGFENKDFILLLTDVYKHKDIGVVDFLREVRELEKQIKSRIKVVLYSAKRDEALRIMPELDPASGSGLTDVFSDKHGGIREDVRSSFEDVFNLKDSEDSNTFDSLIETRPAIVSIPPPLSVEFENPDFVNTWLDDIKTGGRLGGRWNLVVGRPDLRLRPQAPFVDRLIERQHSKIGKLPDTFIIGLGENIEGAYLSEKYPNMERVDGNEIDPKLLARSERRLFKKGLSDRMNISSRDWHNLPDFIDKPYDLIFSWGNEIECLPSRESQKIVLHNIFKILNSGGTFSMDMRNMERVLPLIESCKMSGFIIPSSSSIMENPGYPMYNSTEVVSIPLASDFRPKTGERRVVMSYEYANREIQKQEGDAILTMLLTDIQVMVDMLNEVGFNVSGIYGDYKGGNNLEPGESITKVTDDMRRGRSLNMVTGKTVTPNFFQIVCQKLPQIGCKKVD